MANLYKSKFSGKQIDAILDAVLRGDLATFAKDFKTSDWTNNEIRIPYDEHDISAPNPSLFMLHNNLYEEVIGGIVIDSNNMIIIQSDVPFDGRIII